jgi:hypothetical protein
VRIVDVTDLDGLPMVPVIRLRIEDDVPVRFRRSATAASSCSSSRPGGA